MTGDNSMCPEPPLVPGVERIAVLRPNGVGDFIFALPALEALRAAYPHAHITLLGKAWHADFLRGRPGPVDHVEVLPPVRGVGAEAHQVQDDAQVERFLERMRRRRFDLALQLFGGGRHSNPFVQRLGARMSAGLRAADAPPLDRWHPHLPLQNERLRLLEAVALVGARPVCLAPRLALAARDQDEARLHLPEEQQPLIVLQPGASDTRRRWPAHKFAAVADALHGRGYRLAINGTRDERAIVARVRHHMRAPALDLSGVLSLSGLAGLLARARLLVSNDTGPLHLAQALGTATVGIYWFTNLLVSAPLAQARHRHLVALRSRCPACGAENLTRRCRHDPSFVDEVEADQVLEAALELLAAPSS